MNDNGPDVRAQMHSLVLMTSVLRVLAMISLAKVEQSRDALWAAINIESSDDAYRRQLVDALEALMVDADALRSAKKP